MAVVRPIILASDGTKKEIPSLDVMLVSAVRFDPISGDLASPTNGDMWYNGTSGKYRVMEGGVISDMLAASSGISVNLAVALATVL